MLSLSACLCVWVVWVLIAYAINTNTQNMQIMHLLWMRGVQEIREVHEACLNKRLREGGQRQWKAWQRSKPPICNQKNWIKTSLYNNLQGHTHSNPYTEMCSHFMWCVWTRHLWVFTLKTNCEVLLLHLDVILLKYSHSATTNSHCCSRQLRAQS